jgi:hypothetical protein
VRMPQLSLLDRDELGPMALCAAVLPHHLAKQAALMPGNAPAGS